MTPARWSILTWSGGFCPAGTEPLPRARGPGHGHRRPQSRVWELSCPNRRDRRGQRRARRGRGPCRATNRCWRPTSTAVAQYLQPARRPCRRHGGEPGQRRTLTTRPFRHDERGCGAVQARADGKVNGGRSNDDRVPQADRPTERSVRRRWVWKRPGGGVVAGENSSMMVRTKDAVDLDSTTPEQPGRPLSRRQAREGVPVPRGLRQAGSRVPMRAPAPPHTLPPTGLRMPSAPRPDRWPPSTAGERLASSPRRERS